MLPSAPTSAYGKPMFAWHPTSLYPGSAKYPPVTCAPHSSRCPTAVARPSDAQASACQPKCRRSGATNSEGSATRPVITTCASVSSAAMISPIRAATLRPVRPSSRATATVRSAAASGFATPMLVTMRGPSRTTSGSMARIRRGSREL